MRPLTYTELSAPTVDPADSVMYPNEGEIELTRRARIRERELLRAEASLERAMDLVRYQRMELFDKGLITREEYADLLQEKLPGKSGTVARLETYDDLRAKLAAAGERERGLTTALHSIRQVLYRNNPAANKGLSYWPTIEVENIVDAALAQPAERTEGERT